MPWFKRRAPAPIMPESLWLLFPIQPFMIARKNIPEHQYTTRAGTDSTFISNNNLNISVDVPAVNVVGDVRYVTVSFMALHNKFAEIAKNLGVSFDALFTPEYGITMCCNGINKQLNILHAASATASTGRTEIQHLEESVKFALDKKDSHLDDSIRRGWVDNWLHPFLNDVAQKVNNKTRLSS